MANKVFSLEKARQSRAFLNAKERASTIANDPKKLSGLIDSAAKKAGGKKGLLDSVWVQLMSALRLIKAYANGTYREIPWSSLLTIIAAVAYFVMPVDAIPDFILGFGLIDDIALLGWALKAVNSDIEKFTAWESAENRIIDGEIAKPQQP